MITTVLIAALVCLAGVPLVTIWAINMLFGTAIPFNFYTWFACLWLLAVLGAQRTTTKSKS